MAALYTMFQEYRFTYLLMGLLFLVVWIVLFSIRRDNRKAMLAVSIVGALLWPTNLVFMEDWWNPISFWGPDIGIIESMLVGFTTTGIAAVLYEDVLKKKIKPRKARNKSRDNKRLVFLLGSCLILFFGLFYVFNFNSLIAFIVSTSYGIVLMLAARRDLIIESIISGVLMLGVAVVTYTGLELLNPGWLSVLWSWETVPEVVWLNVPLNDVIYYFLFGMWAGPLYEYWQEGKFVDLRRS